MSDQERHPREWLRGPVLPLVATQTPILSARWDNNCALLASLQGRQSRDQGEDPRQQHLRLSPWPP